MKNDMKMKKFLKFIWNDITSGENIDQYLTIIAAFGISILNLVGFASQNSVTSLTLAVVGLLAISSLVNRHRINNLFDRLIIFDNKKEKMSIVEEAGLSNYYTKRGDASLVDMIINSKKKLDLLGTSLPDMTSDRGWMSLRQQLHQNTDLKVRILLLNPKSIMAYKKRNLNFYKLSWKNIIDDIYKSMNVFISIYKEFESQGKGISERYDVRLYITIPTTSCVFNDQFLNISFYDEKEPASMTPAWIYKRTENDDCLYNYYQRNFEIIWQSSISVFDPDFDKKVEEITKKEVTNILKNSEIDFYEQK
jgi:hypothetical protein